MKKAKDVSEWGVPEWRASLQGEEFTGDDDGVRRVITDVGTLIPIKKYSDTIGIVVEKL